jgi:uncharacterized membrane protein
MLALIAFIAATDASTSVSVKALLIGLLVTALVAAFVYFGGRETAPRYAGSAAFVVLLVGALLTLLWAL